MQSPEEYLAMERKATHKSEYVNGHIFAMAGASAIFADSVMDTLLNPEVIIEVLSDSTEDL